MMCSSFRVLFHKNVLRIIGNEHILMSTDMINDNNRLSSNYIEIICCVNSYISYIVTLASINGFYVPESVDIRRLIYTLSDIRQVL